MCHSRVLGLLALLKTSSSALGCCFSLGPLFYEVACQSSLPPNQNMCHITCHIIWLHTFHPNKNARKYLFLFCLTMLNSTLLHPTSLIDFKARSRAHIASLHPCLPIIVLIDDDWSGQVYKKVHWLKVRLRKLCFGPLGFLKKNWTWSDGHSWPNIWLHTSSHWWVLAS